MIIFKKERFRFADNTGKLILIRFIFSIGTSAAGVVWSLYMNSLGFSESSIGFIAAAVALFSLFFSLRSTITLEYFGPKQTFIAGIVLYIISYSLAALQNSKLTFILISFIVVIATTLRVNSFGILFRDSIKKNDIEEKEGLLFTFANLGWLITPPIAGLILEHLGFNYVFILSSGAFTLSLIIFSIIFTDKKIKKFKKIDRNIMKNLKDYLSRKELFYPYIVLFGLRFIDAFIFIFLPLILKQGGVSELHIGYLLGAFALVHFLFDFKIGRIAPKFGYKKLFTTGFILAATIFFIATFFYSNMSMIIVLMILLSFVTLLIEPIQDSFFFSKLKKKKDEEKFFPIFSTAIETGNLFGKLLVATILLITSDKLQLESAYSFVFFGMSIVLMIIAGIISGMKK